MECIEQHDTAYVTYLKHRIKACVVDKQRKKDKEDQIAFFEKKLGPSLDKLNADINCLEEQLAIKRAEYKKKREALAILEGELDLINAPLYEKHQLQELLNNELHKN